MPKYKLNEDFVSISPNSGSSQGALSQNFSKDDIIDGDILQAGILTTTFRGFAPQGIIGNAFFPIPLSKLTKVDETTPIKVKVLEKEENPNKKYAFLKNFRDVTLDPKMPEYVYTADFVEGDVIISNRKDTIPTDGGGIEPAITYVYPKNTNVVFRIPERILTSNVPSSRPERILNPITIEARANIGKPKPKPKIQGKEDLSCEEKAEKYIQDLQMQKVERTPEQLKMMKDKYLKKCKQKGEETGDNNTENTEKKSNPKIENILIVAGGILVLLFILKKK